MLIGNLGRDPELRYTPGGTPVTTFSLASSRMWVTPEGDRREATEWFNIVAWRRLAEICEQHLSKGARVYVEGRLQTRAWDDTEGNHHQCVEVVAHEMIILDGASRDAVELEPYHGADIGQEHTPDARQGHDEEY
jgi:single-strand DNA-binding protein